MDQNKESEKKALRSQCDWIIRQATEIRACLALKDGDTKLNAQRELVAISSAMDSLRELELHFKQVLEG